MRNAFTRRTSAIAVAGVLALAGAACGDDEPDTNVDVTEDSVEEPAGDTTVDEGDTTVEETELDMGTETDTEMDTEMDMGTETETAG